MTSKPAQPGPGPQPGARPGPLPGSRPGSRFARGQPGRRPGPDPRPARSQPGGPSQPGGGPSQPGGAPSQPGGGPSLSPRIPLAEAQPAMFGYLAAIFLGPLIPLVMYLIGRRRSPFRRFHAATALNLSLTGLLYALCCLILAGLLLLDSLTVALVVAIPVALVIWLTVLKYLIRGIGAANRGERYEVPAWICAQIAK
jgi:uncharacterized Tic20 family protein